MKIVICFIALLMMLFFISCLDSENSENPGNTRNYTNVENEGRGEFDGYETTIINNSSWTIRANIYKADGDKAFIRTVEMNRRGDDFSFYDPSTITVYYAPIFVEVTGYSSYIKANLNTKNHIYLLDK